MNEADMRMLVIAALDDTTRSLDNPTVSVRLRTPGEEVALAELGLDSMDMVEWSVAIEKHTGVSIDTADMVAAATVSDVVRAVLRQAGR